MSEEKEEFQVKVIINGTVINGPDGVNTELASQIKEVQDLIVFVYDPETRVEIAILCGKTPGSFDFTTDIWNNRIIGCMGIGSYVRENLESVTETGRIVFNEYWNNSQLGTFELNTVDGNDVVLPNNIALHLKDTDLIMVLKDQVFPTTPAGKVAMPH